jgi:hypothetical protein
MRAPDEGLWVALARRPAQRLKPAHANLHVGVFRGTTLAATVWHIGGASAQLRAVRTDASETSAAQHLCRQALRAFLDGRAISNALQRPHRAAPQRSRRGRTARGSARCCRTRAGARRRAASSR